MDGDEAGILLLVKALSKRLNVSDADWQVGHTKIFLRRELSDKLERLAKLRVQASARILTRFGRTVVYRKLAAFLVAWTRLRLVLLNKKRAIRAANTLARTVRGFQQRKSYRNTLRAVILIQSQQRRRLAVKRCQKLNDPYCDMIFRECKRLLASEQERIEKAAQDKDFERAKNLEEKM
jgi:myosin heavy subunit